MKLDRLFWVNVAKIIGAGSLILGGAGIWSFCVLVSIGGMAGMPTWGRMVCIVATIVSTLAALAYAANEMASLDRRERDRQQ